MLITEEYRKKNEALHKSSGGFGGKAQKRAKATIEFIAKTGSTTVLDYGCGKGGLVHELRKQGFDTQGYDPAIEEFQAMPSPADFVVFYEGPEHIEEKCVDAVLEHVASLTKKAAWIVTALRTGGDIFEDGTNAHVTVKDGDWWLERFRKHFNVEVRANRKNDILDVLCFTR